MQCAGLRPKADDLLDRAFRNIARERFRRHDAVLRIGGGALQSEPIAGVGFCGDNVKISSRQQHIVALVAWQRDAVADKDDHQEVVRGRQRAEQLQRRAPDVRCRRRWAEQRRFVVDAEAARGRSQRLRQAYSAGLSEAQRGGLRLRSGEQRFYEGLLGFRFPPFFSGVADVFRIEVRVSNPTWGPLFGYSGSFTAHWLSVCPGSVPTGARPCREEQRL
jgi:hypothetical protein